MPDVTWTHTFLDVFLHYVPRNVRNVLDVGCGRGIVGSLLKIYRDPERIVGVDLFDPYLDFCKRLGVYSELRRHDLGTTPLPFADREFDMSVALEVIEHLPKIKGYELLGELERVSRTVIMSTPNRYFHQSSYDDNRCQEHLSRWKVQDLRRRGYFVLGVGWTTGLRDGAELHIVRSWEVNALLPPPLKWTHGCLLQGTTGFQASMASKAEGDETTISRQVICLPQVSLRMGTSS